MSAPASPAETAPATDAPASAGAKEDLVAVRPATKVEKSGKEVRRAEPAGGRAATSGKTYVVVKGDNPVKIARKLGVSYDALLEVNKIDDPRKLQIGQKLLVPAKSGR